MTGSKISADDVIKYLRNEGYKAEWKDGTAIVYLDMEEFSTKGGKTLKVLRAQLEGLGFHGSVGVAPER